MAQDLMAEGAAASTPAAGYVARYAKTDGLLYSKDDAGNEYLLSGAATTGYPSIASHATTMDIFAAAGATVGVSGTVTVTAIPACTSAQVGSAKTIIPSDAAGFSITASANIVVDGATSGTYLMPQNANIQIIATSTTTFKITTIFATGTWSPNQGSGLTVAGAFSSSGSWVKTGRKITLYAHYYGATSIATTAAGLLSTNSPFTAGTVGVGTLVVGSGNDSCGLSISATTIYIMKTISAQPSLDAIIEFLL